MSLLHLTKLLNRKIIRIQGPDSYIYLQGLVSNDVRQLYKPGYQMDERLATLSPNAISAFMMNSLGRAICDMLIFRTPNTSDTFEFRPPGQIGPMDELYIECDANLASSLTRTLTAYRVKRKVSLSIEDHLNVWCIYQPSVDLKKNELTKAMSTTSLLSCIQHDKEIVGDKYILACDPRLAEMGLRVVTPENDFKIMKEELKLPGDNYEVVAQSKYIDHRYKLGINEGLKDNLESVTLPLECNADYLRSVSFTKGCYLGQELTARIHHTGVVRKRIMPIILSSQDERDKPTPLLPGSDIINEDDTLVGKIRNVSGSRGLALMRVEQTISSKILRHKQSGTILTTHIPYWWPLDKKDSTAIEDV